ncbi:hypothetical protein BDB01DRAFT_786639 [Pilobolus umbonatus]|nr:hypothetical protein BDB01DRAFT_786639 [Pilobolus umbonatus]
MPSYPVIRNPLLASPPAKSNNRFRKTSLLSNLSLASATTVKSTVSNITIRGFMNHAIHHLSTATAGMKLNTNKRIMPSMPKSHTEKSIGRSYKMYDDAESKLAEPIIHYNGPYHTLEALPEEKLIWIKNEMPSSVFKNPVSEYDQSIVLRKPMTRSSTFPQLLSKQSSSKIMKPKAMFYLRTMHITATDTSKTRLFRCGVQVNDETCYSSTVTSEKNGKNASIIHLDETFLFDVEEEGKATIHVYAQPRVNKLLSSMSKKETCIGRVSIDIPLHPKSKCTEKLIVSTDSSKGQNNDIQLVVVYGVYMSRRTQNMINSTKLYADYITLQIRVNNLPRFERFWGILRGVQFELYDFEYKESRPALHIIPLNNFSHTINAEEDDGGEFGFNIGTRGLVLQFTDKAADKEQITGCDFKDIEYRMNLMPESSAAARTWELKFNYVASIYDEIRETGRECYADTDEEEEEEEENEVMSVPLKFIW